MEPLKFDPLSNDEDFFVPILSGAKVAKIELPGGARYTYFVDVSDVSSAQALTYLQRMKDHLKKTRFKKPGEPPATPG